MKREFIINIILLVIINLLIKPVYIFGVEARIQNLVGTESYGVYFDYFNFVFLFQFLNDPGIQNWNAQFMPKNREIAGYHIPGILMIKGILALFFIMVVLLSSLIVGYSDQEIIIWLCVNMILSTLFMYLRGTIAGLGYYRTDSLLSVIDKFLMIVILGYLSWFSVYQHSFEISTLVYGQGLAYVISCVIAAIILSKKVSFISGAFSVDYFKKVLKWSSPYVLILLFMTAYNRIDGVMLGRLLDDNNYQAGVYATAYRFYDAANMIGYLFAALLLPMFAANAEKRYVLQELKDIGIRFAVLSAVIIVLSLFFYGDRMLRLLFAEYELQFFTVLRILIISYVMVAIAYIFGTMLVACGKVGKLNYLFGFGLIINILLNAYLIPKYMAIGAAIATLVTQTFVMTGQIWLVKRDLKIDVNLKETTRLIIFILLSSIVFFGFKEFAFGQWYIILILSILICVLLSFILNIINRQVLLNLFKKEM